VQIDDQHIQGIWYDMETDSVNIIDQTRLPHEFKIVALQNLHDACHANEWSASDLHLRNSVTSIMKVL
jgi:hypothetical protein